ncbi:MAG TPA: tetratricopeptide repeat protein [Crinalium sp.]|jgi:tetratricopeptide (TPR) repeat protein/tRNA A-37 threonylcarbamoyl transferase component Bud32
MLGKTVGGRYQIIRYLGGGGFGQTYLAEDWHLPGRPQCVVKQLKPKVTDAKSLQTARRLFNREAEVLYTLGNHDQIPRLFAHFEESREFYLVQEFIEGDVLSRELKRGKILSEDQVVLILHDILTTLEFVHQQQVIHRDIKPSNLIRRKSDQKIVMIDFGAVKQIGMPSDDPEQTSITIAIGSMGYMPNEQLAGKPRVSSDVYAVGMVGIRALAGMYPAQLSEDPKTGEVRWRDKAHVSPELADILDTMVRYDFRHRYQSAADALKAISALLGPNYATAMSPPAKALTLNGHMAWFERGDELFQLQRYREAVACYDKVIQALMDDYLVWFKRGIALENLQEYEEAIASYDRVIQLQPDDYLAWFKRGKALENLQEYEEAIACYDKVIQLQPDNYWAWHDRGRVLELSERYEEAVAAYDRAVQLKPDFELAAASRKHVLQQLENVDQLFGLQHYDEAVVSCDRAVAENPEDALAWLMRGMALENLQRYEEAITSYDQVVHLQPDDHVAWFKRGTVMEHLKRYEDALMSYNKVIQIQPENYWAWYDRGRVLEILQQNEAALVSYDKAVQIKPDLETALEGRQRILHYLKQGHHTFQEMPVETAVG